jgi:hypothetical protein
MTYQTVEVLSEPTWEDVELSTLLGMDRMWRRSAEVSYVGKNLVKYFYLLHIANINNFLP